MLPLRTLFDGGLKRAGAMFLTAWAVILLAAGLGLVLYGLAERIDSNDWQEPLSIGVAVFAVGAGTWYLARRLDLAARQARARRDESRVLQLARQRGGRLTVTEAAVETGLTAAESEVILRGLAEGGFVEIEVSEAGIMTYRFPEFVYASTSGSAWSRRL